MRIFDLNINCELINDEHQGILSISAQKKLNIFDWLSENKSLIEKYLLQYGGILLRDFEIYSVSEFSRAVQIISPNLLDYTYRSTPRTKLGGKIYTSTEYPANRVIPLHNENSYSNIWPNMIFFFSVVVASQGGETPIADSRKVYERIDQAIRERFEKKGILYVRNYTTGIDLSWQDVFQTDNKDLVSQYCHDNNIEYEWRDGSPELTIKQICQATVLHPVTRQAVWFNQAHLFHISALEESERTLLRKQLGKENMPRNVFYGDGQPIESEVLEHICEAYNKEKIKFKWRKGDIMILDNLLTAHGREAYEGERKVAVAMS